MNNIKGKSILYTDICGRTSTIASEISATIMEYIIEKDNNRIDTICLFAKNIKGFPLIDREKILNEFSISEIEGRKPRELTNDEVGLLLADLLKECTIHKFSDIVKLMDLSAFIKLIQFLDDSYASVKPLIVELFSEFNSVDYKRKAKNALEIRNKLIGHLDERTKEKMTDEELSNEIDELIDFFVLFICDDLNVRLNEYIQQLETLKKKTKYFCFDIDDIAKESLIDKNRIDGVFKRYSFDGEGIKYYGETNPSQVYCVSKELLIKEIREKIELDEKLGPYNDEREQNDTYRILKLTSLLAYEAGRSLMRYQVEELASTHSIILDKSVIEDADSRKYLGANTRFRLMVDSNTRKLLWMKKKDNTNVDCPEFAFVDHMSKCGRLSFFGLPSADKSSLDLIAEYIASRPMERFCVLTRGATKDLSERVATSGNDISVVAKIDNKEIVVMKSSLPFSNDDALALKRLTVLRHESKEAFRNVKLNKMSYTADHNEGTKKQIISTPDISGRCKPVAIPDVVNQFNISNGDNSSIDTIFESEYIVSEGTKLHTENGSEVILEKPITQFGKNAEGGEGAVYLTNTDMVAKIYHRDRRTKNRYDKLKYVISKRLSSENICWPEQILYGDGKCFVGFLMKKVPDNCLPLNKSVLLLDRESFTQAEMPTWNRTDLIVVVQGVLKLFKYLHDHDVLMGDVNPGNIMVDVKGKKQVYFVDCDSYQMGDKYTCPVGTKEYTHPKMNERLGGSEYIDFGKVFRTKDEELYSIAIIAFKILMLNKSPFSYDTEEEIIAAMKDKKFAFENEKSLTESPGPYYKIWINTPYQVRQLFSAVFSSWTAVSLDEWIKAFRRYYNERERYRNELMPQLHPYFMMNNYSVFTCKQCKKEFDVNKKRIKKDSKDLCESCKRILANMPTNEICELCGKTYGAKGIEAFNKNNYGYIYMCPDCRKSDDETVFELTCEQCKGNVKCSKKTMIYLKKKGEKLLCWKCRNKI